MQLPTTGMQGKLMTKHKEGFNTQRQDRFLNTSSGNMTAK